MARQKQAICKSFLPRKVSRYTGHHIVYCRCALIGLTTHVLHDHTHARTQLQALRQEQLRYQEEMAEKNKVRQKGQHQGCDKPTQWMFTIVFLPVPA